jgi:hypothetical protein
MSGGSFRRLLGKGLFIILAMELAKVTSVNSDEREYLETTEIHLLSSCHGL